MGAISALRAVLAKVIPLVNDPNKSNVVMVIKIGPVPDKPNNVATIPAERADTS